jgi:YVTN family beta-propeller protein
MNQPGARFCNGEVSAASSEPRPAAGEKQGDEARWENHAKGTSSDRGRSLDPAAHRCRRPSVSSRVIATVSALLAAPCMAASGATGVADPPARSAKTIRLAPLPAGIVAQCRAIQARVRFRMLCPRILPRPLIGWPPGHPPSPLAAGFMRPGPLTFAGIDIGYGAGWDDPNNRHAWRNRPCCFLHFVVQRGRPAAGARPAVLGGRKGRLLPANTSSYYGPYFGNHVRFFFRERGVPYVVTLHTFGRRRTTALLGRLIRELRPAASLRVAPTQARIVPFDNVGPRAIAAGPGALWILTRDKPVDPTAATPYTYGRLLRLDPESGRIQARIRLDGNMRGLAAAAGSVWVAAARPLSGTRSEGIVLRVDASRGTVSAVVRTGTWPSALASDGRWLWAVNTAPFFKRGTLVRIDTATNRRVGRAIPLGPAPSGIAMGAGSVWVADALQGTVRRIDGLRRRTIATIRVGRQPYGLTFAAGSLWVTNSDEHTVSRIDPATNHVRQTITVGRNPYGIASGGTSLWVANLGDGSVSELDAARGHVRRTLRRGGDPLGVAVAGEAVWMTQNSEGRATRLD